MNPIRTLEDLIHKVVNSLSLISSHAQFLLGKTEIGASEKEDLQIIYEEAERAASLLSLVPRGVARLPLQDPAAADSPPAARRAGTGSRDAQQGKGRRRTPGRKQP